MMKRFLYGIGCGAFAFSAGVAANEPNYVYPPVSGVMPVMPMVQQQPAMQPMMPYGAMPVMPAMTQGMLPAAPYAYPQMSNNPYAGQYTGMQPNMMPPGSRMPMQQVNQAGQPVYPPANMQANANPYQGLPGGTPGPYRPPPPPPKKPTKPWGDTRYIWPDYYTDFTGDFWDSMINAPYEMGYMPGGWRFPSFSSPDPVTVGDAVANQIPPIMEEVPNFINFAN